MFAAPEAGGMYSPGDATLTGWPLLRPAIPKDGIGAVFLCVSSCSQKPDGITRWPAPSLTGMCPERSEIPNEYAGDIAAWGGGGGWYMGPGEWLPRVSDTWSFEMNTLGAALPIGAVPHPYEGAERNRAERCGPNALPGRRVGGAGPVRKFILVIIMSCDVLRIHPIGII